MHNAHTAMGGRYGAAIAVMTEMGWSWGDLCNAPADLVQEILMHLHYRQKWTNQKQSLNSLLK